MSSQKQTALSDNPSQMGRVKRNGLTKFLANFGQAINHDFCPSLNKFVYWMKEPVGWVVATLIASGFVGVYVGPQGFLMMWTALALLILGVAWPWLCMKGISCTLEFQDARATEGKPVYPILKVVNRWPVPVFGLTVEGLFLQDLDESDDKIAIGLQKVGPLCESQFVWETTPCHRGMLPGGEVQIATSFPFGLRRSARAIVVNQSVIVHPDCYNLESMPKLNGDLESIRGFLSDNSGKDGDVIGVRQYQRGDSLKNIHWSQTAKHNQIIVRERQSGTQPKILIAIDFGKFNQSDSPFNSSYEWSIRIASSVAKMFHDDKAIVNMTIMGLEGVSDQVQNNFRGLNRLLDILATLPAFDEAQSNKNSQLNVERLSDLARGHCQTFLIRSDGDSPVAHPSIREIVVEAPSVMDQLSGQGSKQSKANVVVSLDSKNETITSIKNNWARVSEYEPQSV